MRQRDMREKNNNRIKGKEFIREKKESNKNLELDNMFFTVKT